MLTFYQRFILNHILVFYSYLHVFATLSKKDAQRFYIFFIMSLSVLSFFINKCTAAITIYKLYFICTGAGCCSSFSFHSRFYAV